MFSETTLRLGFFLGLFALFALAEAVYPRRPRAVPRQGRWPTNLALVLIDTATLRLLALALPLLAVGAAVDANRLNLGLLAQTDWPLWVEGLLALLLLDLAIWAQHLLTHRIPILWRLHRVHHADRDMDVTTAIRFHPVEIAASMLVKIGLVYLIGPPVAAVIAFEILLNGTALFNHANLALPRRLDAALRLLLVTPDMHRVHHSTDPAEHNSNYGFSLSVWDRLFGTYVAQPRLGHRDGPLGLQWQDAAPARLGWSLLLPFRPK